MDAAAKQFEVFQERLKEHKGKIRRRGDRILHLEGALEKAEGTIAFMQGQVWIESVVCLSTLTIHNRLCRWLPRMTTWKPSFASLLRTRQGNRLGLCQ